MLTGLFIIITEEVMVEKEAVGVKDLLQKKKPGEESVCVCVCVINRIGMQPLFLPNVREFVSN